MRKSVKRYHRYIGGVLGVLCVIMVAVCIVHTNTKYHFESKKTYSMNQDVEADGYIFNVKNMELLSLEELSEKYGDMSDYIYDTESVGKVAIVQCEITYKDQDFPLNGINLQSLSYCQGLTINLLNIVNPGVTFKTKEMTGQIVNIPFLISKKQFYQYSDEKVMERQYELVVHMTPVITVRL